MRGKQTARAEQPLVVGGGVPSKTEHRQWRYRRDHWVCGACRKVSRATAPPRSEKCAGYNAVMADLMSHPNGHALSFSSFLNETVIILSTKCGGHCSSNRKSPKLAANCKHRPVSPCGWAALARLSKLQHPRFCAAPAWLSGSRGMLWSSGLAALSGVVRFGFRVCCETQRVFTAKTKSKNLP